MESLYARKKIQYDLISSFFIINRNANEGFSLFSYIDIPENTSSSTKDVSNHSLIGILNKLL